MLYHSLNLTIMDNAQSVCLRMQCIICIENGQCLGVVHSAKFNLKLFIPLLNTTRHMAKENAFIFHQFLLNICFSVHSFVIVIGGGGWYCIICLHCHFYRHRVFYLANNEIQLIYKSFQLNSIPLLPSSSPSLLSIWDFLFSMTADT